MSVFRLTAAPLASLAAACAVLASLAGCGSFDSASQRIAGAITPYRPEVVQGNFVSKEQAELIKPGMTRQQVKDALGTPLVTSVFHADRWDYVFTLKRQGVAPQERRFTVYFKGDALDRTEGDELPSEADFVASLDNKRKGATIPPLEATEAQLNSFAAGRKEPAAATSSASAAAPAASAPVPTNYPPLEAPTR
jgi:outer membrane protein assembly factor BamE